MQDNSIDTFIDKNLTAEKWNNAVKMLYESNNEVEDEDFWNRITKGALVRWALIKKF